MCICSYSLGALLTNSICSPPKLVVKVSVKKLRNVWDIVFHLDFMDLYIFIRIIICVNTFFS